MSFPDVRKSETTKQPMELAISGCRFYDNPSLIATGLKYDRCIYAHGEQSVLPLPFTRLMLDLDAAREEKFSCVTSSHVFPPNVFKKGSFNGQQTTLFTVSTISHAPALLPEGFELTQSRPVTREPRPPGATSKPKKAAHQASSLNQPPPKGTPEGVNKIRENLQRANRSQGDDTVARPGSKPEPVKVTQPTIRPAETVTKGWNPTQASTPQPASSAKHSKPEARDAPQAFGAIPKSHPISHQPLVTSTDVKPSTPLDKMSWAEQSMYPEANENVGADGNTIIADIQGELSKLDIILRPEQTVAHADSHVEDKPQKSLGAKVLARCASGGG